MRRTEADYRRIFSGQRKGETLQTLANRHGVKPGTLSWWRRELARRDERVQAESKEDRLLPVRVKSKTTSGPMVEVMLQRSGHVLRIRNVALGEIVEALEGGQ